jgi:hypothetical protein
VSWLWRDELRILLTPRQVRLQRRVRGVGAAVVEHRTVEVTGGDPFHWAGALETLATLLAQRPRRPADAEVILSNHFVRYTRVPATDLLVTRDDELRFAQQDFARVYGPAAERWHVSVSGGDGEAALASGVADDLVEALRAALVAQGLRPRSLQPALMAAFNAARSALPEGATRLVAIEPGMAVSALLAPNWKRIRSQRIGGVDDLDSIVQRERALDDVAPDPETVCVLPLTAEPMPDKLADGTPLRVLPPLWLAPADSLEEQAA